MARSSRFRDFTAAVEQREPIEFVVPAKGYPKGRTYLLPGDPPASVVARIVGANAEGGLRVELAQAQLALAQAELALAVMNDSGKATDKERAKALADIEAARKHEATLHAEMDGLIVDLLGKDNAEQIIADGAGFYAYNKILAWVPVAYGIFAEETPDPAGAARAVVAQLRELPTTKQRPELLVLLDQFDAVIAAEVGENGGPKATRARKVPQDRKPKTTRVPSASRRSSRSG
jgi:hypothetical protein